MADLELKQSEAKTIQFTITDSDGTVVDVSSATAIAFNVKKKKSDTTTVIGKTLLNFDVTDAANGIITVNLSVTDTLQTEGKYIGELTVTLSASNVDKSADISIDIIKKVA